MPVSEDDASIGKAKQLALSKYPQADDVVNVEIGIHQREFVLEKSDCHALQRDRDQLQEIKNPHYPGATSRKCFQFCRRM